MAQVLASKPCEKCGLPVPRKRRTDRKAFYYPKRCVNCHGFKHRAGAGNSQWRGGRVTRKDGYVMIHVGHRKYALEHRMIWEDAHGAIPRSHHVHHLNHDPADNRLENLALMSHVDHSRLHGRQLKPRS